MNNVSEWFDNFASTVKGWVANAAKNPKTTALGIAAVVGSIKGVIADPSVVGESWWWTSIFAAIGLLTAKDAEHRSEQPPEDSSKEKGKE